MKKIARKLCPACLPTLERLHAGGLGQALQEVLTTNRLEYSSAPLT